MAWLRRSLSEDGLDRYNHTWSFLLLIVLSLVSWFMSFSPVVTSFADQSQMKSPKYAATCWFPNHFTQSHIEYARKQCESAINAVYSGRNYSEEKLYLLTFDSDDDFTAESNLFKPVYNEPNNTLYSDARKFLAWDVPYSLLVYTVIVPGTLMWVWLSVMSVDTTHHVLHSAMAAVSLDAASRTRVMSELAKEIQTARGSLVCCHRSLTFRQACYKTLQCWVVAYPLFHLYKNVEPDLRSLQSRNEADLDRYTDEQELDIFPSELRLFCSFGIMQSQNVATTLVQCLFTHDKESATSAGNTLATALMAYAVLLNAVLVYLIALLFINVLSLVTWICRLVVSRFSEGAPLPTDVRCVLLMSQTNCGPLVTRALVQSFTRATVDTNTGDGIPLAESDTITLGQ